MLKLALLFALQMNNAHAVPRYSLAQLSRAMEVPPRLQLPAPKAAPTPAPAPTSDKTPVTYTIKAWEAQLDTWAKATPFAPACQCLTLVISPEGNILGTSKACSCE